MTAIAIAVCSRAQEIESLSPPQLIDPGLLSQGVDAETPSQGPDPSSLGQDISFSSDSGDSTNAVEASFPSQEEVQYEPAPAPDLTILNESMVTLEEDEIWLVSTRGLSANVNPENGKSKLKVWRRLGKSWQTATIDELLSASWDGKNSVIWCHGNRFDFADSKSYGLAVYRALKNCPEKRQGLRFIIWSWPSDRVAGPIRDARIKGERALCEGRYVGWLMGQMAPGGSIGLLGYSFGSRVAAEGARRYFESHGGARLHSVQLVLLAPALDQYWLLPGNRYQALLAGVDRLAIYYNSRDIVLKRYRLLYRRGERRTALGYVGAPESVRSALGSALTQLDVTRWLRREHSLMAYLQQDLIRCGICKALFCNTQAGDAAIRAEVQVVNE